MRMPKDALTIYRAAQELDALVGGKIDKVNMPDRDTMILLVHTRSGNKRLLLSCNPSLPRAHITERKYVNPDVASGMLMYFRKRLVGAGIAEVIKDRAERVVAFRLAARDELLRPVEYVLYAELTGKCANIVFVENGVVGNALRRVTAEAPGKRAVLPGLEYAPPNATGRVSVFDKTMFAERVTELGGDLKSAVDKTVSGLARATVVEILGSIGADGKSAGDRAAIDAFIDAAAGMYDAPLDPTVTFEDGAPVDYFCSPYRTVGGDAVHYPTLNAAMDAYYSALFDAAELAMHAKPLKAAVKSAVNKNKKRLAEASDKLEQSSDYEKDKLYGELITANIYRIKRGDDSATLDNWYDGGTVAVTLDPTKTAAQNAAARFKSYNKKKTAIRYAEAAADTARAALDRLDGITAELALCTTRRELAEVREELVALGLIKQQTFKKGKKQTEPPSEPYAFDIDGATLMVGKNHAQNDRITRGAAKTDTWLHVKDAHGCHAVLKTAAPTSAQLERAAEIAAYYSASRGSENVAVDYTLVKHVHPHGGGRVEYTDQKTLYVTPKP